MARQLNKTDVFLYARGLHRASCAYVCIWLIILVVAKHAAVSKHLATVMCGLSGLTNGMMATNMERNICPQVLVIV